jgi:hypothetical protein
MPTKLTKRPEPKKIEYGKAHGYKKSDNLFGFVFEEDIRKWYGRQKGPLKYKPEK